MIVLVCILAITAILGITLHYHLKGENIPFKSTTGNFDLPVVHLYSKGKKLNFIVDTGASNSLLDINSLDRLEDVEKIETDNCALYGIDGKPVNVEYVSATLHVGKTTFREEFQVTEIPAIQAIKTLEDMDISGFLGSSFLRKHKANIDFDSHTIKLPKKLFLMITKNGLSRN